MDEKDEQAFKVACDALHAWGYSEQFSRSLWITALEYARNKQAEPVAWMDEFGNVFPLGAQRGPKHLNEPMKPLYAHQAPAVSQEPDFKPAYMDWHNKTEWVQEKKDWPFNALGMHRADVMKKYIEHLEMLLKPGTTTVSIHFIDREQPEVIADFRGVALHENKQAKPYLWMTEWWVEGGPDNGEYEYETNFSNEFSCGRKDGFPLYRHPAEPVQPAGAQEPVRLNDDDLTKIYMRFVGHEGLSPRLFEDIAGCVMTAMFEKSLPPSVSLKCSSDVCEFEIQNEDLQKVNEELLQALKNIAATGYSNIDRDNARSAIRAAEAKKAKGGV